MFRLYLNILIFLLLFFTALALFLCLFQPFDKRSGLGMDLFGKFLGDVLLRNLGGGEGTEFSVKQALGVI